MYHADAHACHGSPRNSMLVSMKPMDRRRFLIATAATAASLKSLAQSASSPSVPVASLTLHADQPGASVPRNFIGLSYETQQLSDPTYFSPRNEGLIREL